MSSFQKIGRRENKYRNPLNLETKKNGSLQFFSSNQSIESHKIVGKRAVLRKEFSPKVPNDEETWILHQPWLDTLLIESLAINSHSNF